MIWLARTIRQRRADHRYNGFAPGIFEVECKIARAQKAQHDRVGADTVPRELRANDGPFAHDAQIGAAEQRVVVGVVRFETKILRAGAGYMQNGERYHAVFRGGAPIGERKALPLGLRGAPGDARRRIVLPGRLETQGYILRRDRLEGNLYGSRGHNGGWVDDKRVVRELQRHIRCVVRRGRRRLRCWSRSPLQLMRRIGWRYSGGRASQCEPDAQSGDYAIRHGRFAQ